MNGIASRHILQQTIEKKRFSGDVLRALTVNKTIQTACLKVADQSLANPLPLPFLMAITSCIDVGKALLFFDFLTVLFCSSIIPIKQHKNVVIYCPIRAPDSSALSLLLVTRYRCVLGWVRDLGCHGMQGADITGQNVDLLCTMLVRNTTLQKLSLEGCNLQGAAFEVRFG